MMKKRLLFVAMLPLLILNFGSCGQHTHEFGEWEQVAVASCSAEGKIERGCECGYVEQRSVPRTEHTPGKATCTSVSTCTVCGAVTGSQLGHVIVEATCTTSAYCSECKAELGEKPDHKWQEATCAQSKICLVCLETQGEPLGHSWQEATCTTPNSCTRCGYIFKNASGHEWLAANCTTPKTCTRCDATDGDPLGHAWNNVGTQCWRCGSNRVNDTMGILMNGDIEGSNTAKLPYSPSMEARTWITSDDMVRVEPLNGSSVTLHWMVDEDVNVRIEDFPVVMILTRNLCTCGENGNCFALESCHLVLATDSLSASMNINKITELDMVYDPILRGGDSYLYFYNDYSKKNPNDQKGRINGIYYTVDGLASSDPDGMFDICFIGFFKTIEAAETYIMDYYINVEMDVDDCETEYVEIMEEETLG